MSCSAGHGMACFRKRCMMPSLAAAFLSPCQHACHGRGAVPARRKHLIPRFWLETLFLDGGGLVRRSLGRLTQAKQIHPTSLDERTAYLTLPFNIYSIKDLPAHSPGLPHEESPSCTRKHKKTCCKSIAMLLRWPVHLESFP